MASEHLITRAATLPMAGMLPRLFILSKGRSSSPLVGYQVVHGDNYEYFTFSKSTSWIKFAAMSQFRVFVCFITVGKCGGRGVSAYENVHDICNVTFMSKIHYCYYYYHYWEKSILSFRPLRNYVFSVRNMSSRCRYIFIHLFEYTLCGSAVYIQSSIVRMH